MHKRSHSRSTAVSSPRRISRPVSREAVHTAVHDFIGATIRSSIEGYRYPEFRASSFPYCPILAALAEPTQHVEYKSDFYFAVGTALHGIIQAHAAQAEHPSRMWGCWRCTGCEAFVGAEEIQRRRPPGYKPSEPCSTCAAANRSWVAWDYVEVTVKWRGLSGHVDTVLEIAPNAYIVVDYKTTRFKFGGSGADRKFYPYGANVVQVEVYCTLLRELFGIHVVGWALVYIDRTKPITGPRDYHISTSRVWGDHQHRSRLRVLRWANQSNVIARRLLEKRLAGQRIHRAEIDELIECRPCKTHQRWRQWMKSKFKYERDFLHDGAGACPHLETCTCGDSRQITKYFQPLFQPPTPPSEVKS